MFIYHFNRMIRSRILWIIFAVVIAFAFLSVDSCYRNPGGGRAERNPNEAGTIAGESVSYDEYDFTRRILANTTANLEPAATETQIWAHIAAMRTAKELGLSVLALSLKWLLANSRSPGPSTATATNRPSPASVSPSRLSSTCRPSISSSTS